MRDTTNMGKLRPENDVQKNQIMRLPQNDQIEEGMQSMQIQTWDTMLLQVSLFF